MAFPPLYFEKKEMLNFKIYQDKTSAAPAPYNPQKGDAEPQRHQLNPLEKLCSSYIRYFKKTMSSAWGETSKL